VQHADRGKTRLHAPSGVRRADLARAIASDALSAVLACPAVGRVVLVTSDPVLSAVGATEGADVVPDPGAGLTAAVEAGIAAARAADRAGTPLGVLLPDVPALRPQDLATALDAVADRPLALVPDLEGTGSVLLASGTGGPLPHAFGDGSAARHLARGAELLALDLPRLRRDVDTVEALHQAAALGLGPRTTSVLGRDDQRAAG
jgi:2-phospho-L-lactate guanylyltransferase